MAGVTLPHHRIRLSAAVKADLEVWLFFLQKFNGVTIWSLDFDWQVQIFSDAAGADGFGFGFFWEGRWCSERWPVVWRLPFQFAGNFWQTEQLPFTLTIQLW